MLQLAEIVLGKSKLAPIGAALPLRVTVGFASPAQLVEPPEPLPPLERPPEPLEPGEPDGAGPGNP